MRLTSFFPLSITLLFLCSCSFKRITRSPDIIYNTEHQLKLDVFAPKKIKEPTDVFIFIHGGNWIHGEKSTYKLLGKTMAKNGVTTVVIDYRMGAAITYEMMATDAAKAIKWTKENISAYGGDSSKLFVSGHSAGGHLAALVATDDTYFKKLNMNNPLKGVILIDAFGLDMYAYLKNSTAITDSIYFPTFSKTEEVWKNASPINHLHTGIPPFLIFLGTHTYPGITQDNNSFLPALKKFQSDAKLILKKRKNHYEMIYQFWNSQNKIFNEITYFMKTLS